MFKIKEKIIDLGDGRIITLETGRMARQAEIGRASCRERVSLHV
jgi:hypothetical protein